ncbi:hypothetical protein FOL47_010301 [Perkinsus chesapeaki]|uniref:RING-type E3 ubiquitin transferase n=1 Tax=Perkinsus chesapeaki TaxID=330153 RepID=A0A7J6MPX0_PERCH|nr:hypothetical protein FOL47_010301 [Perkinsus chesapeaki]
MYWTEVASSSDPPLPPPAPSTTWAPPRPSYRMPSYTTTPAVYSPTRSSESDGSGVWIRDDSMCCASSYYAGPAIYDSVAHTPSYGYEYPLEEDCYSDYGIGVCRFYQSGLCKFGEACRNLHIHEGESCRADPQWEEKDRRHKARLATRNVLCAICDDDVIASGKRFGLLENCDHPFCLECIREWRDQKDTQDRENLRLCPLCRVESFLIVPCDRWLVHGIEKQSEVEGYKRALSKIPCKFYQMKEECPFGSACYYNHGWSVEEEEQQRGRMMQGADDFYGAPPHPQDSDDIDLLDPTLLYLLQTRFSNQQSSLDGGAPVLSLDSLLPDSAGSPDSIPAERNPFGVAGKDNDSAFFPGDFNAPVGSSPVSSAASIKAVEQTAGNNKENQESKRVVPERVLRNTLMLLARNGCRLPLKKFEEIYAKEFGSTFDSKAYGFGCLRLALLSLPGDLRCDGQSRDRKMQM